ncbi:MAG: hypothetical protein M1142_03525 [Patescibacteria group bacterium]|nr:hypothetical protein [Patescibacteria group bacterium]
MESTNSRRNQTNTTEFGTHVLITRSQDEFAKRRQLWNEHGTGIIQDEKLLAEYAQPIQVKGNL